MLLKRPLIDRNRGGIEPEYRHMRSNSYGNANGANGATNGNGNGNGSSVHEVVRRSPVDMATAHSRV